MVYDKKIDADKDFNERKEKVIRKLDGVTIVITNNKKVFLNREILTKDYSFDDGKQMYDKYDDLITDGSFIISPTLKEVYLF